MMVWRAAPEVTLIVILVMSGAASGQSTPQRPGREENLSEKVINPIAMLTKITVENKYSPSLWASRDNENQVEGELVLPYKAFARQSLLRIKLFFETRAPDGTHGLSESEIFDLLVSERRWGSFGVGIAAHLSAESSNQLGTVAPGPAAGVIFKHEKWKYGVFNQNFLSDSLARTELQPVLAHAFDEKWSAEIGDAQYTYDWKKHRVTSIPMSGQVNRILHLKTQKTQLFFRGQYNLKNESGSDKWTLAAGFTLIVNQ
jgi:hypothetical protein